jgi:hypothetical protein
MDTEHDWVDYVTNARKLSGTTVHGDAVRKFPSQVPLAVKPLPRAACRHRRDRSKTAADQAANGAETHSEAISVPPTPIAPPRARTTQALISRHDRLITGRL